MKNTIREINKVLVTIIMGLLVVMFVREYVVDIVYARSGSMKPTIEKGDYILVNKLADVTRFDMIMFQSPDKRDQSFAKRIIGIPGDTVKYKDGELVLNGKRIKDEQYLEYPETMTYRDIDKTEPDYYTKDFDIKKIAGTEYVPTDFYYVMGDNRRSSRDSRIIGFIDESQIQGKIEAIVFPKERRTWFDTYNIQGGTVMSDTLMDELVQQVEDAKDKAPDEAMTVDVVDGDSDVKQTQTHSGLKAEQIKD